MALIAISSALNGVPGLVDLRLKNDFIGEMEIIKKKRVARSSYQLKHMVKGIPLIQAGSLESFPVRSLQIRTADNPLFINPPRSSADTFCWSDKFEVRNTVSFQE